MSRINAELSHRAQQLETRLAILEAELSKTREEVRIGSSDVIAGFWTPETPFALLICLFHTSFKILIKIDQLKAIEEFSGYT